MPITHRVKHALISPLIIIICVSTYAPFALALDVVDNFLTAVSVASIDTTVDDRFSEANVGIASADSYVSEEALSSSSANDSGELTGLSVAGGASGSPGPMISNTFSALELSYKAVGGGPVDLDLDVEFDGFLDLFHGAGSGSVFSRVELVVSVVSDSTGPGGITLFDDFVQLILTAGEPAFYLESTGFSGDGTFDDPACDSACKVSFSTFDVFSDLLTLAPGEAFTLYASLITRAEAPGGFETFAATNFDDTVQFGVKSTSGSFELIPSPIPLPPMMIPFVAAGCLLSWKAHQRKYA